MNCTEFDEIADSYLSDELLVETNHDLIRHLENCGGCRNVLAQRRELRTRMRSAVRSSSVVDPVFASRVRTQIRAGAGVGATASRFFIPAFAAAAVLFAAFLGVAVYLNTTTPTAEFAQANIEDSWHESGLMSALHQAIGNHKNCGLKFGNNDAKEVSDEPDYAALRSEFAANLELVEKHDCIYNGRRYAHTILRSGAKIISILKTESDATGDSKTIVSSPIENFQIAEFESGSKAIFVISDLPEAENLQIARTILNKRSV